MYIYILVILAIILLYNKINNKKINVYDIILLLILILVCGLRDRVGTDYGLYKFYYNNIDQNSRFEIGFRFLIELSNKIGMSYNTFLILIAAITITLFYVAIKKYSSKPAASIFFFVALGYYAYSFNIIRQMLAIAITLYGINYIKEKKFFKYLILILIASSFHSTALIMIPIYFLLKLKNNKKNNIILVFICVILPFLYNTIFTFIVTNFEQYSAYATINDYTYTEPGIGTYVIGMVNFVLFILFAINRKKLYKLEDTNDIYLKMFSYSLLFTSLSFVNSIAARGGYYLSIYIIYLLPNIGTCLFKTTNKSFEILVILFFILYYFIHIISFNEMLPYNSIL